MPGAVGSGRAHEDVVPIPPRRRSTKKKVLITFAERLTTAETTVTGTFAFFIVVASRLSPLRLSLSSCLRCGGTKKFRRNGFPSRIRPRRPEEELRHPTIINQVRSWVV